MDPFGITSGHNPVPKKPDLNNSAGLPALPALPASCQHITEQHNPCMPRFCETCPVNVGFGPAGPPLLQIHFSTSRRVASDQTTTHHEIYYCPPTEACNLDDRFQWRSCYKMFEDYKIFTESLGNCLRSEHHRAAHNLFHDSYIACTQFFQNDSKPHRPQLNPQNDNH